MRVVSDNLELHMISPRKSVDEAYRCIVEALAGKDEYDPVCLNELAPTDRYRRRHWIEKIQLPYRTMIYRYSYGNCLGVVSFLWKIPAEVDETKAARLVTQLTEQHKVFASREMKREFFDKYHTLAKASKSVLRNIYKSLMDDCSAASSSAERIVDDHVAEALLNLDDPDFIYDLRQLNDNPGSSKFDVFWEELGLYIEELTPVVDDRRHSETLHVPVAISLHHLLTLVKARIEQKYPNDESKLQVPSVEWLRLQFWPNNPYSTAALRHTWRINLKFGVQTRQLHHEHVDSKYVSVLLRFFKDFCVQERDIVNYISVDDKAIISVGEPGLPVSSSVRGHNRSIVLADGPSPSALDHDFHVHGIVPSVAFAVKIPISPKDSFYCGKAFVCVKDKVTQPSSALRHATELSQLLKSSTFENDDDVLASKPILVTVSDGGPDHRITFVSVQLSLICLFISLNLDMLVVARTCPYQSWQNIVERVMSTLNLALMNIALARNELPQDQERLIHSKKTLMEVRKVIARHPEVNKALVDSMQQVLCTLSQRFSSMEVKGEPIGITQACSDNDMKLFWEQLSVIQPNLSYENMNKSSVRACQYSNTAVYGISL